MARRAKAGDAKVAVGYLRVSTEDQKLGPEAQRAAIEAWAAREGVRVAAWHVDAGVSGATAIEARPALGAALAALREHGAGVLVVAKRDRVARDVMVAMMTERATAAAGARLVSADGTGNGDTPADQLMRTMLDAFAAHERAMIAARTKAALAAKRAKGERVSRHVPFGFRLAADGIQLEADDDEQAIIARVRALQASGVSTRRIVAALTAEGVTNRNGRPLHQTAVCRILGGVETNVA